MDERADQIEAEINRARGDLNNNLQELEDKVKSAFDWRTQFEEHPLAMLGLAFGGGLVAAALIPRARRHRYVEYENGEKSPAREYKRSWKEQQRRTHWEALTGALMTAAASRVGTVLGQLVNNYRDRLREERYRDAEDYDRREPAASRSEASRRPH
jgi:hypothetical protein